ncbi:MAG: hypothetical protein ACPGTU_01950 [Myxococcota bacterium]
MSLRPFTPDPEVMGRIRAMQATDADAVARLHFAAMGNSTWAQLGERFLRCLYTVLIDDERFLGFVYQEDNNIRGFIAGSQHTDTMFTACFQRAWPVLAMAAFPRALRPKVLSKLIETRRYNDASGGDEYAESLFCSFEPNLRGKRVSGHINKVLFDDLLARGHTHVKVTTEVDNEAANRQLTSWGFEDKERFTFYGKEMVKYILNLETCERVEPISRHPAI